MLRLFVAPALLQRVHNTTRALRCFSSKPERGSRRATESHSMRRMQAMFQLASVSTALDESPPKSRADFLARLCELETVLEEYIDAHSGDNINHRDATGGPLQGADDGCDPYRAKLAEVREILSSA